MRRYCMVQRLMFNTQSGAISRERRRHLATKRQFHFLAGFTKGSDHFLGIPIGDYAPGPPGVLVFVHGKGYVRNHDVNELIKIRFSSKST